MCFPLSEPEMGLAGELGLDRWTRGSCRVSGGQLSRKKKRVSADKGQNLTSQLLPPFGTQVRAPVGNLALTVLLFLGSRISGLAERHLLDHRVQPLIFQRGN